MVAVIATNPANAPPPTGEGNFQILKRVTGSGAELVGGVQFTANYTVNGGAPQSVTVTNNDAQTIGPFPVGTQIALSESTPPPVPNVGWGTPTFTVDNGAPSSTASFTIGSGTTVQVVLENPATDETPPPDPKGTFSVRKLVQGEATGQVGGTIPITYTYTDAGGPQSGQLNLVPNGAAQSGPQLDPGTVVTISEQGLPNLPTVVWGTPSVTIGAGSPQPLPASFTIGDGTTIAVVVTNQANPAPVPGYEFTKASDPPSGSTVRGGDTITYFLTGVNIGELPLDVTISDDLSQVLNNATVISGPT